MSSRVKKGTRTSAESRALDTYVKLLRASESVHAAAVRTLPGHHLTPSQFAVLEALYHVGPLCLSDLARKILKTGGNLTMVVRNLEKRGLVIRERGAQDRRYVSVAISDKGKRIMDRAFPQHARRIVQLLGHLSAQEQERLGELCRKLGLAVTGATWAQAPSPVRPSASSAVS